MFILSIEFELIVMFILSIEFMTNYHHNMDFSIFGYFRFLFAFHLLCYFPLLISILLTNQVLEFFELAILRFLLVFHIVKYFIYYN